MANKRRRAFFELTLNTNEVDVDKRNEISKLSCLCAIVRGQRTSKSSTSDEYFHIKIIFLCTFQRLEVERWVWSTFVVQIGTPAYVFHVLPSTISSELRVLSPEGCQTQDAPAKCGELRGVYEDGGFQNNILSTFDLMEMCNLVLEQQLSDTPGTSTFGYHTVALQVSNPGGPSRNT